MQPADLSLVQGDDYSATVSVFNPDGSLADLTGYTPKAQMRRSPQDATSVDIASSLQGQSVILLSLTNGQTASLDGGYVWDLQVTSPTGTITTLLSGNVSVTAQVTR